ncbi:MAG: creatininase family protein [Opitutales bacterium]|jgi:creatinine amidohydrolase|nr:creatininase family protein [Opitutales bacterium]MDP4776719.1 creatininase family protein [Opitutales bacterium]MDP4878268.1 creatininase family protein [Opitutales bacterium]MDP4883737.1 creatininase family protein [Opitutales bacterium]MDP5079396.1 creatininase family protein [Opitutales bacterium]
MFASSPSVCIEQLPWPKVKALQESCALLVLPLGATEQHGPALPLNTDTVIANALCSAACGLAGVPMAPVMPYTSSGGHTTKWPGTFSLTPKTFIDSLVQFAKWAEATGWQKLYIVNAHAGNDAPMRVAVDQIRIELMGRIQVGYLNTFFINSEIEAHFTEDAADLHANKGECDLMLYLAPDTIDQEALADADDTDRTADLVFTYPVSQTSLNGTTGKPSLGNADDGKRLFNKMRDALVDMLERAKIEEPPLPRAEWASAPKSFYC